MTVDKLLKLYELLSEWAGEVDWDKQSTAWATVVECKRQVEIDLRDAGVDLNRIEERTS